MGSFDVLYMFVWDHGGAGIFDWEGVNLGEEDVHLRDRVVITEDAV